MAAENDFLKARTQIAARIQKLETDLKYWREELQAFDRVETTMRRLVDNNGGDSTLPLKLEGEAPTGRCEAPEAAAGRTEMLNELLANPQKKRGDLKNRVLAIVHARQGEKVSATDVERAILQSGFKPGGKHFDVAVYQTLKRLADAKQLVRKKYAGKVTFSANVQ